MRLNIFQKLIQQWDAVHPYNAAQMMRLRVPLDFEVMNRAWVETQEDLQIVTPPLAAELLGDAQRIDAYLSDSLNRPFAPGESPFRAFICHVDQHTADECVIGVVYQHWMADSVSVRALLREWYLRRVDPTRRRTLPMAFAREGYWKRFGPQRGSQWNLLAGFWTATAWAARMKSCRRIEVRGEDNLHCRFSFHYLPLGIVPKLLRTARAHGATLNDLFLAVIAEICDRHVAARPIGRRRHLALGTIVDLRAAGAAVSQSANERFGMYLGFTSVVCRPRDLATFELLLQSIALQNRRAKKAHADRTSMLRIAAAVIVGQFIRGAKLVEWYRKRVPFVAGISNVNLNKTWVAAEHPFTVAEYVRVSPIGPMLPVVFTPSTLGDDLNFGLTWRDAVVSPELANQIATEFIEALTAISASAPRSELSTGDSATRLPLRLARGA